MNAYALHEGVAAAFSLVDAANEYIAENEPWALAKDPARSATLDRVLYDVAEAVRVAAILLLPVMPASASEILRRVGEKTPPADIRFEDAAWRAHGEKIVTAGAPLWPRLETRESKETVVNEEKLPPQQPAAAAPDTSTPQPAATDDRLSIDDFMKIQLRVAKVLAAEKVPNSRKLMRMQVDLGTEQRTIVAGIADAYEPDQLVGRTIAVVANLKPAKLMGIESNGMLLAASPDGGKPVLIGFDEPPPSPGTRIR
jgi:methionyl-tRNA synthetase